MKPTGVLAAGGDVASLPVSNGARRNTDRVCEVGLRETEFLASRCEVAPERDSRGVSRLGSREIVAAVIRVRVRVAVAANREPFCAVPRPESPLIRVRVWDAVGVVHVGCRRGLQLLGGEFSDILKQLFAAVLRVFIVWLRYGESSSSQRIIE